MEYESVSQAKRLGQVISSVIFCFLTAGVVFGYAALKPVLVDNQVYGELCEDGKGYCKASDIRMNFMFTLATVVTNGAALPIGSLLDKFGPQKTAIGGSLVFLLGNVVFGLQMSKGVFDTYIIGYVLLALGSPAIFLSQFHLSNAFPAYSGVILAAITGAFDASSVPYLIYRELYQRLGGVPSIRTFFWVYTAIPVLIILQQLLMGPKSIYDRGTEDVETSPLIHGPDEDDGFDELARARSPRHLHNHLSFEQDPVASGFSRISYPANAVATDNEYESAKALDAGKGDAVVGVMYGKGVKEQASSSWFWLIAVYLFVQMIRINWYLATVQSQLEFYTGNTELADTLTKAFTVLLPLGGIIGIPFVGLLLDRRTTLEATLVLVLFGLAFGVLTILPQTAPQLIGIGFLVVLRPLFYTYVSDFFAKVFGFVTFGRLYGLAMTISGFLGLLLTPMDILTQKHLNGNYNPINITLIIVGALTNIAVAVRLYMHTAKGKIVLEG